MAVFLPEGGIRQEEMQKVAKEMNFSEYNIRITKEWGI
ncbi:hypothetical protein M948_14690 [Virgibacillus sp. CM-4]|nr:hypothetical protein M948_14690 [Virgibacillus sp. CM-4]